jgi:alkylhydroperoxidase family enzyme
MSGSERALPAQWRGMRPARLLVRLDEEPRIGAAAHGFGRALLDTLDGRTAETVALRVGAVHECAYVWRGHCRIALAHPTAALTREDVARIAAGPEALHGVDRWVVTAIDALLDRGRQSRDNGVAVSQIAPSLVFATAFYDAVAALMDGAEPEPDALPIAGLETPAAAVRWLHERSR